MIRVGSSEDHGLALDVIQTNGGTQSRATLNQHVVDEYAEAIKAGATFPPIVVFYDGKKHWLADGFHRHYAAQQAGRKHIRCLVRSGGLRDAILWSVGANAKHGLARSDEDKRRAVERLLDDAEWSTWTDRDIAKRCHVSHPFVAKIRKAHAGDTGNVTSMDRTFVHPKTGKPTTMKTAGINAERATVRENRTVEPATPEAPDTKASEPETAELPASPAERIILDEFVALWCEANSEDREGILGYLRINGFIPSSNPEQADVNRSAERASSAVEVGAPVSPEGATKSYPGAQAPVTSNLAAAREGDESAASVYHQEPHVEAVPDSGVMHEAGRGEGSQPRLPSDRVENKPRATAVIAGAPIPPSAANPAEPEATPSPPPASGNPFPDPHSQRLTTGGLHTSSDDAGAKSNGLHSVVGQGGGEPGIHHSQSEQQDASATQARNEPGSVSGATVTNPKPFCLKLKDGHCKIAFETAALCAQCNAAKARAA